MKRRVLHECGMFHLFVLCGVIAPSLAEAQTVSFVRGDPNSSGDIDISDAVFLLGCQFLGSACPDCRDSGDANDDGTLDLSDPVFILNWLFIGGASPPPPTPDSLRYDPARCAGDPTADGLDCHRFAPCAPPLSIQAVTGKRIYALGEPIAGSITVSSRDPFAGRLEVGLFEHSGEETEQGILHQGTHVVDLPAGGSIHIDVEAIAGKAGHFVLLAQLYRGGAEEPEEEGIRRIGVRPEGFPGEIPDNILKADIETLSLEWLRNLLENGAASGQPVSLPLGSRQLSMKVEAVDLFSPDAEAPEEVREIDVYQGVLWSQAGDVAEPESQVVLTVGRDGVFGMVARIDRAGDPEATLGWMWIEPLRSYVEGASPEVHLVYEQSDTIPNEGVPHVEPILPDIPEALKAGEAGDAGEGAGAPCATDQRVPILLRVYEHERSSLRTQSRLSIVAVWRSIVLNEFQGIPTETFPLSTVSVSDVRITHWEAISDAGYGGSCGDVLHRFRDTQTGVANRLYALFTNAGSGCGGIASLGGGFGTTWHSIVRDGLYSLSEAASVFGQETGHNLDWHLQWATHDPHLDISEFWYHTHKRYGIYKYKLKHCTIMRFSYDGCDEAELRFKALSDVPLVHLAAGMQRYFAGPVNDRCADAIPIIEGAYCGTTLGTEDANFPNASCGESYFSPDVWYSFRAPAAGTLRVDTCDSIYDTVLSIHSVCPSSQSLREIACNDDAPPAEGCSGPGSSLLEISTVQNTTYLIRVSAPDYAATSFTLHVDFDRPPCTTPVTTRVSVSSAGAQANAGSGVFYSSSPRYLSSDGRFVAFESIATNLVTGDRNNRPDVFVRDTETGQTTRASVATDGSEANGPSGNGSISGGGRHVVFTSSATNLLGPGEDTNGLSDLFVRDLQTGTTARVNVSSAGAQANDADRFGGSISRDGRLVAFFSTATNLVEPDGNGTLGDIYVRDLSLDHTTRVSVSSSGQQDTNAASLDPAMSADGRFVVFSSYADILDPADTNGVSDIYVRDLLLGRTFRVSVSSGGVGANDVSTRPSISGDGRYIAFESKATNLEEPFDTNNEWDIFVHDVESNTTHRVSVSTGGGQGNGASAVASISDDGRYVAFYSDASDLVPGDTNMQRDAFLHDIQTRTTVLISRAAGGGISSGESSYPSPSGNGRAVAFFSVASDLIAGDTNGSSDIFVRECPF